MAARSSRVWVGVSVVVAAIVVGAMLFGVGSGERTASAATATTTHRLIIPPAAFIPVEDGTVYENNGLWLQGNGWFTAQIPFYRPGERIQMANVTLFAVDNHGGEICATLYRTMPASANENLMAQVCSTGAATGVRTFTERVSAPRFVTQFQGAYLWLRLTSDQPTLRFYGVRVTYKVPA